MLPRPQPSAAVASGLAAIVGVIAIAGGYLGSSAPNLLQPQPPDAALAPTADVVAAVRSSYPLELGPFALPWIWIADRGSLIVQNATEETGYVGFLGLSLRRPRTIRVGNAPGRTIGLAPRAYLVGPIKLSAGDIPIRVSPGAERATPTDRRRVSVFLSTPVISSRPFAAIPGKGFYPEERTNGRHFNWMMERGVLELAAPVALDGPAVVRLRLWSPTARRLRIDRDGGATSKTISIGARRVLSVVVGGISMRAGRGRLILMTLGTTRGTRDARRLSLQLLGATRVR